MIHLRAAAQKILEELNKMNRIKIVLSLLVLVTLTYDAGAQKYAGSIEALRGVEDLYIVIENIPDDFISMGLPQRELQGAITQQLQKAGIKVRAERSPTSSRSEDGSHMYVNLSGLVTENGSVVYNAMVRIDQSVIPAHNRSIIVNGGVWYDSKVGVAAREGAAQTLKYRVGELVDAFVGDYKAVN